MYECSFCECNCNNAELGRSFQLKVTLADDTAKVLAWCTGTTAAELLQISATEFFELPEVIISGNYIYLILLICQ